MSYSVLTFAPTLLTLLLLGGLGAETLTRPRPADAEPYHRRVREAADRLPLDFGSWHGEDESVAKEAVALLRPNKIIQRRYESRLTRRSARFLFVHCKDARDMVGHYPPNCYPGQGWVLSSQSDEQWDVGGRAVAGREYEFTRTELGQPTTLIVCNVLVLPSGKFVHDMNEIAAAASDYTRKFCGAAQFHLVFQGTVPENERREMFCEIMGQSLPMLEALSSGVKR